MTLLIMNSLQSPWVTLPKSYDGNCYPGDILQTNVKKGSKGSSTKSYGFVQHISWLVFFFYYFLSLRKPCWPSVMRYTANNAYSRFPRHTETAKLTCNCPDGAVLQNATKLII